MSIAGISGVKSREDLVMSNTDLSAAADPFGSAPFKPPAGWSGMLLEIFVFFYYYFGTAMVLLSS